MYIAKQPNDLLFLFMEKPIKKSDEYWYPDIDQYKVDYMELQEDEIAIPNLTTKAARKVIVKLAKP